MVGGASRILRATERFVSTAGGAPDGRWTASSPTGGCSAAEVDGEQWLRFAAAHTLRHHAQLLALA